MSDEKVIPFPGVTSLDTNPANVLRFAAEKQFERVIVIGIVEGESGHFISCSCADGGVFLYDLARAQHHLMKIVDRMENDE